MLPIILLAVTFWISKSSAQVTAIRSPWADPTDPSWLIAKTSDRNGLIDYAIGQFEFATLVYFDKLPQSNGNASFGALLSNEHVGIGQGFDSIEYEALKLARLTRRAEENQLRNVVPVSENK